MYIKDDFLKTASSRHFNFVVAILVASLIFVVFALGFVALLRCHYPVLISPCSVFFLDVLTRKRN